MTTNHTRRDLGFTLPELLISLVITSLVVGVIALTISVSYRTLPDVTDRADSAVAVQGITTWLPPDVDSTEPDRFFTDPARPSGCAGVDPGQNMLHLGWSETFAGVTTNYVANYRFVVDGTVGRIVRVTCEGVFSLGAGSEMTMSAQLSTLPPIVTLKDSDSDGRDDQVRVQIITLSGDSVYIDAATKNPNETLPPNTTNPPSPPDPPAPNQEPEATAMTLAVNPDVPVTFTLTASDLDGDPLTATLGSVPAGWTYTITGLEVTLTPVGAAPGTYNLTFAVTDPDGAFDDATLTIEVVTTATTTTTTTTTSTTLPPCVVSGVTASPSTVKLQNKNSGKLGQDVSVVATVTGGYCVGLTLQYDTGAPNGQYVQSLGDAAPYDVTLRGHPHGTELWAAGSHVLEVRDGGDNLLAQTTLQVTN